MYRHEEVFTICVNCINVKVHIPRPDNQVNAILYDMCGNLLQTDTTVTDSIEVGQGNVPGQNMLMIFNSDTTDIKMVSFSTGWGSDGYWPMKI